VETQVFSGTQLRGDLSGVLAIGPEWVNKHDTGDDVCLCVLMLGKNSATAG